MALGGPLAFSASLILLWPFFSMCRFHEGGTTELLLGGTHAFMNQSFDTYGRMNNAQQSVNEELACARLSTCRLGSFSLRHDA